MRVHLCAIGRLRQGPERDLIDDYKGRFDKTGRPLALGPLIEHELEDRSKSGMMAEAALLQRAVPHGARLCVLDERGSVMTSPEFAALLAKWRDQGVQDTAFVIGGADGLASDLRGRADVAISFGKMVWPHLLVRVMICEQLYRAAAILAGSPYHRA